MIQSRSFAKTVNALKKSTDVMVCHNVEMEVMRKVANQSHNAMTSTRFCAPNKDVFQVIIKQR